MFLNRILIKLVLLFLLFIGLDSCAPAPLKNLEKQKLQESIILNSPIQFNKSGQANYRCKIEAFDQLITGVLIFKKVEQDIRVVMITDFGLKVMDVSLFKDGSYQVNYMMKHLDYKFVRESFSLNLMMLLEKEIAADTYIYQKENTKLFLDHKMIYYLENNEIFKVERYRGKNKLMAIAEIQKSANIDIQQLNPKMRMALSPIE